MSESRFYLRADRLPAAGLALLCIALAAICVHLLVAARHAESERDAAGAAAFEARIAVEEATAAVRARAKPDRP